MFFLGRSYNNFIQMQKKESGRILFSPVQGILEKLSGSFFLGFQPKFWSLSDKQETISYRNMNQKTFPDTNIFLLKEVTVLQGQNDTTFKLKTNNRQFVLRAADVQQKNMWMSSITKIKKGIVKRRSTGAKIKQFGTVVTEKTQPSTTYNPYNPESEKKKKKNQEESSLSPRSPNHSPSRSNIHKKDKKKKQSEEILNLISEEGDEESSIKKIKRIIKVSETVQQEPVRQRKSSLKKNPSYSENKKQQKKVLPNFDVNKQTHSSQTLHSQLQILQTLPYSQYLTKLPEHFILNNIWVQKLRYKPKSSSIFNIFSSQSASQFKCILFSAKSLFPQIEAHHDNLLTNMLPSWAQVDAIFKIMEKEGKIYTEKLFEVEQILQVIDSNDQNCFRINIGEHILEYEVATSSEKNNFKNIINIAKINAHEATINHTHQRKSHKTKKDHNLASEKKKTSKRNYDKLINLNEINTEKFKSQLTLLMEPIFPQSPTSEYSQIQQLIQSLEELSPFLQQMFEILENKVQQKNHVILEVLDYVHEQLKIMIKITWDSEQGRLKAGEILQILGGMAKYYDVTKDYKRDEDFFEGMKELSKVYIRETWKNFETIIVGIVLQDKNGQISERKQDQFEDPPETAGITDLFRFIYDVFDLACKPWSHKLHIHNVNKLMQRALKSYITQLRETIDEEVINPKQLAAIANGYFRISQMIEQFYNEKFANVLKQHTKQYYDKITRQYRELSLIIIGKIVSHCQISIRRYFASCQFSTITNLQQLYQIIKKESSEILKYLHLVFVRKYYDKVLETIKIELIQCLINNEVTSKKSTKATNNTPLINRVTNKLDGLGKEIIQLLNAFITVDKYGDKHKSEIDQTIHLLTTPKTQFIVSKLKMTLEPWKGFYQSILTLRGDYYENSKLQQDIVYTLDNDNLTSRSQSKSIVRNKLTPRKPSQDLTGSLSKNYLPENGYNQSMQSRQKSDYDNSSLINFNQNELRLISEGYMHKSKLNKKLYEKLYFRLKKSTLYIFADELSQSSLNSISVDKIQQITHQPNKDTFDITYSSLNRIKKVHFKAQSSEVRDRWVKSLQLQLKRIKNQQQVMMRTLVKQQNPTNNSKKKKQFIIDYEELAEGENYFSYH